MAEIFDLEARIDMLKATKIFARVRGMNDAQAENFLTKAMNKGDLSLYDTQGFNVTEAEFLKRIEKI